MSKEKRRVPKLRFPGFTEDWEQCKLSVLATMNARIGWQNLRTSEFLDNGDYLLITGTDFDNGRIKYSTCHYVEKKRFDQDTKIQLSTGSILITKDGTLGKVALVEELPKPATLNAGVFNVRVKDDAFLSYKYLYHYLQAPFLMKYVTANATGGTIKHLNQSILVDFPIPITGKQEQDRIAKLLDSLESIITLHQRKLNNLKLKKKALLQKLFPKNEERYPELRFPGFTDAWEQRKFKDIAFKRGKISEADLPYVEFEDINSGIGTLNKNISQKVGHKKGLLFEAGDVLFGKLRPYLQNWLLCQFAGIAVGDFWVLQPQNVSSAFLYYLIQSEAYQSVANISSGTKMPRSSWPLVSETLFSIPKYKEANMIGEFFLLIDRTITLHQRKLDHLQLQKKALLQQMFV